MQSIGYVLLSIWYSVAGMTYANYCTFRSYKNVYWWNREYRMCTQWYNNKRGSNVGVKLDVCIGIISDCVSASWSYQEQLFCLPLYSRFITVENMNHLHVGPSFSRNHASQFKGLRAICYSVITSNLIRYDIYIYIYILSTIYRLANHKRGFAPRDHPIYPIFHLPKAVLDS